MSLSIYIKGGYEEFHALRRKKNKANLLVLSFACCVLRAARMVLGKQTQC